MIGQTIFHYKIIEKLGGGGMGVVYKAEDTKLKRFVALKFLASDLTHDERIKARFIHEARSASALDHPNICTIHEINETQDGQLFIVMAYYDGETLQQKVTSNQLTVDSSIDIAIQIAQGLAKAHEYGIIHRDLKPANVMITKDGVVKILDFGIAKLVGQSRLTKTGSTLGTMAYMSPEQARGEEVDHRTDIWALGVMLYEMITGQLPFKGEYEHAVMYSILTQEPQPITELCTGVPLQLQNVVANALVKKSNARYQHIKEMLVDLKLIATNLDTKTVRIKRRLPKKKRFFLYGGLATFLILFIAIGLYFFSQRRETIDSIAVLPLANLSGDANQEYFADGMTEALISVLGQIQALRVISRTSVMQYKTAPKPLPEIAKELNVDAVVEGAVEPAGDHVGITVRLIEAKTEKRLWSQSFERELRDVLKLQKEMALALAGEIKVQVTRQEQAHLQEARAVDPEAYKLYLWGQKFRDEEELDTYQQAIKYFEQAIKADPSFAQAYASLVPTYYLSGVFGFMSKKEAESKARAAAAKALELDETLSEAHTAMAFVRASYDWDWLGAEKEFKQAIKLNPNSSWAHEEYGSFLGRVGRTDESVAEMMRALDLDPVSKHVNGNLAAAYTGNRQYDKAIEHCLKVLQLNPDFTPVQYYLGQAYLAKGIYEEAIAIFETQKMDSLDFMDITAYLGNAYALSGKREKALKLLDELKKRLEKGEDASVFIALIYVGLGEKGKALDMLEQGSEQLQWFMLSFFFDSLRTEPRFQAILKKMGLKNDRQNRLPL